MTNLLHMVEPSFPVHLLAHDLPRLRLDIGLEEVDSSALLGPGDLEDGDVTVDPSVVVVLAAALREQDGVLEHHVEALDLPSSSGRTLDRGCLACSHNFAAKLNTHKKHKAVLSPPLLLALQQNQ